MSMVLSYVDTNNLRHKGTLGSEGGMLMANTDNSRYKDVWRGICEYFGRERDRSVYVYNAYMLVWGFCGSVRIDVGICGDMGTST